MIGIYDRMASGPSKPLPNISFKLLLNPIFLFLTPGVDFLPSMISLIVTLSQLRRLFPCLFGSLTYAYIGYLLTLIKTGLDSLSRHQALILVSFTSS